jgi:hypothetical protein
MELVAKREGEKNGVTGKGRSERGKKDRECGR